MHFYFKKDLSKVFLKHLYNPYICFGFKEAILRGCHTAAFYFKKHVHAFVQYYACFKKTLLRSFLK
jgi:hypothetical protein